MTEEQLLVRQAWRFMLLKAVGPHAVLLCATIPLHRLRVLLCSNSQFLKVRHRPDQYFLRKPVHFNVFRAGLDPRPFHDSRHTSDFVSWYLLRIRWTLDKGRTPHGCLNKASIESHLVLLQAIILLNETHRKP